MPQSSELEQPIETTLGAAQKPEALAKSGQESERTIAAGEFKAKCLKLLDEVAETREPIVIESIATIATTAKSTTTQCQRFTRAPASRRRPLRRSSRR